MPETLADTMRRRLTPTESTSPPDLGCTSPTAVALTEVQQRLLADLRAVLPEHTKEGGRITRIGTSGVLRLLQAVPGSPWRGLSGHKLGRILGSLGVHPHAIRFGNSVFRGYAYSELRNAFFLHLPPCDNPGMMRGPRI